MNMDAKTINLVSIPNPTEHDTGSTIQTGKVKFSFMLLCNRFIKFRKIDVTEKVIGNYINVAARISKSVNFLWTEYFLIITNFNELVWTYKQFVEFLSLTYLLLSLYFFESYQISHFRIWCQTHFKWRYVLYIKIYIYILQVLAKTCYLYLFSFLRKICCCFFICNESRSKRILQ